ncbi:MAG TPA: helix-turn-helix domain-containing protein [Polyangiaceae bacterium]
MPWLVRVTSFVPTERLRPFIEKLQVMETDRPWLSLVLPSPGLVLGVRFGGTATLFEDGRPRRLGNTGLTGVRTTVRRMQTTAGGIVVVTFRELGAAQLFDQPLDELFGAMVPLDALETARERSSVVERVALARSNAERAAVVDAYLVNRLRERAPDALVAAAVAAIRREGGSLRIRALARELGTSQDPLEKRFRRVVGASPKQFAKIVRFLHVVRGFERGQSLTELAHAGGYFDQPHLVRDFRAFTGEAPERFLRAREHC